MKVIVCLDDKNGMLFNQRRQSRDREVVKDIIKMCDDAILHMNYYSNPLFEEYENRAVSDTFPIFAKDNEYVFVENAALLPFEDKISELIVYRWNTVYPSDLKLDLPLEEHGWVLKSATDFAGHSHDKITKEIYIKP